MREGISTRDSQLMKIKRAKGLKYALADFVKDCGFALAFICFNTYRYNSIIT